MIVLRLSRFLLILVGLVGFKTLGEEIPTAEFFSTQGVSDVTVSPDGRYVAARSMASVQVLEFDTLKPVGRVYRDNFYSAVSRYWWVGDDRIALTTHLDVKRSDRPWPTSTFIASNVDEKRVSSPYQLFRDGDQSISVTIIDPLLEDKRNVLVERGERPFPSHPGRVNPHLMRMDVYTRGDKARMRDRQRAPISFGNLYADRQGNARVAVGYAEGGSLAVFYRAAGGDEWTDLKSIVGSDPAVTVRPLGFIDDARFYVLSNHAGDRMTLYRFEPDPARFELVREDDDFDIAGVEWNAAGTQLVGLTLEGARPKYSVLKSDDPRIDVLRRLGQAFRGEWSQIVSQSRDGDRLVANVFSDRNPGAWFLVEVETNKVRPLMSARPGIVAGKMLASTSITVDARDGLTLHGYLTKSDNATEAQPLIVLPHAGPHGVRDTWAFDPVVQFFANRGFAVLRVNYRGSAGYGLEFERAGYRQWGAAIIDDIVDATRSVVERDTIDGERVCIVGTHYGAFAALAAAAREPELFRCAVGHAGIYDLGLIWGRGAVSMHLGDERTLRRWIGRNPAEHRAQSPVHQASRIKVPVFLSHGGIDDRAPLAHTTNMKKALDDAGATVVTMIESGKRGQSKDAPDFLRALLTNADAFHQDEDKVRLYDAIVDFVREHTSSASS